MTRATELQPAWVAPGILGLVFAVLLWARARARQTLVSRALLHDRPGDLPGAGLLLLLTLFVIGCGAVSAVIVLLPYVGSR
ncbi:hypothetical protein Q9R08_06005 [Microbacterium sp. QXD-8]|uniref:Uncharacterized protein n=1 Tax=Microbacterium psychrotolerans TaxID=3068321 RepID=A0ABU0YYW1_9MICO|nr:hypothetical protein [Microbacterium sp. QXD-8]MDQ7877525.1 hypothetical protein [Microbacterium sp. QXD-8]